MLRTAIFSALVLSLTLGPEQMIQPSGLLWAQVKAREEGSAASQAGPVAVDDTENGEVTDDINLQKKPRRPIEDPRTYPLIFLLLTVAMMGFFVMLALIMTGRRFRETSLTRKGGGNKLSDLTEFSDEERQLQAIIASEKEAMDKDKGKD